MAMENIVQLDGLPTLLLFLTVFEQASAQESQDRGNAGIQSRDCGWRGGMGSTPPSPIFPHIWMRSACKVPLMRRR